MRKLTFRFLTVVLAFLVALPAMASPVILGFDTLPTTQNWAPAVNAWDDFSSYGGFSWTGWEVMRRGAYQQIYSDTTPVPSEGNFAYPGNDLTPAALRVSSGGDPFNFLGAMLVGWPSIGSPGSLSSVTIKGYLGANLVGQLTQSFSTTQWVSSGGLTGAVDRLEFSPTSGYFRMDNFTYEPIPEPLSFLLTGGGLLALGLRKRRVAQNQPA